MKLFALLPLLVLAPLALAADLPTPYPEAALFTPATATPVPKGHPAWETTVSVESKGLPLRAVLAAAFESAKLQYAIDPGLDLTIYASVKGVPLREAVAILGRLAPFDVRAENGIWYASRRLPKIAKAVPVKTIPAPIATTKAPALAGAISTQTILVDATVRTKAVVPMRVTPPSERTSFPAGATVGATVRDAKPAMNRRVTTKLAKTDLRTVFSAFSTQTGVSIAVDEDVPRYKIDAFMRGCSLKYALDRICEATGLKYEVHGAALRIVRAG